MLIIRRGVSTQIDVEEDYVLQLSSLGQSFFFSIANPPSINQPKQGSIDNRVQQDHLNPPLSAQMRKDIIRSWYQAMKPYCTLLNLKSYYEIGQLLGKGNFAKVYEATSKASHNAEKFALKTIEKQVLSTSKRNFVSTLSLL